MKILGFHFLKNSKETKLRKSFVSFIFITMFLLSLNVAAGPADQCQEIFARDHSHKSWNTVQTPFKVVWSKLTYMEVPEYQWHPIYQKVEQSLPTQVAVRLNQFLFLTTNGLRKTWNLLGVKGVGFPFANIETQREIQKTQKPTYWQDVSSSWSRSSLLRNLGLGSKKIASGLVLATTSLFALHTAGNVAEVIESHPIQMTAQGLFHDIVPLRDNQIQILNETTPFPHSAIRIGDMVYSHGVTNLTQTPVDIYLREQLLKRNQGVASAESVNPVVKIAKLYRGVDSVVLNLDIESVRKIREFLLEQNNKSYHNRTFINSCATMIARVLREQGFEVSAPPLDASPSFLLSQLALQSLAGVQNKSGAPLVDGFYDIHDQRDSTSRQILRNFLIREMDGAVHLNLNLFARDVYERFQVSQDDPHLKDFYSDSPGRKALVAEIKEQAAKDLALIQDYDLYQLKLEKLKSQGSSQDELKQLKSQYFVIFQTQIQDLQKSLENPNITFSDYHLAHFKIDFLKSAIE